MYIHVDVVGRVERIVHKYNAEKGNYKKEIWSGTALGRSINVSRLKTNLIKKYLSLFKIKTGIKQEHPE